MIVVNARVGSTARRVTVISLLRVHISYRRLHTLFSPPYHFITFMLSAFLHAYSKSFLRLRAVFHVISLYFYVFLFSTFTFQIGVYSNDYYVHLLFSRHFYSFLLLLVGIEAATDHKLLE
jgi:hypothetical protein